MLRTLPWKRGPKSLMTDALPSPQAASAFAQLTRRQKRFVEAFAAGCSGSEAVRQAGYKGLYAHTVAYKWAKRPNVRAAIDERCKELAEDVGVRQHVVLRQLKAVATLDPRKVEDENGEPIPLHKLDPETAAAIAAVEVENISINGETGKRYRYKFWDKVKAGVQLGQYTGAWQVGSTNVNVDARSVTVNGGGDAGIRAVSELQQRLAAIARRTGASLPDPDGSVLPDSRGDGQDGRGASVDVRADQGSGGRA